MDLSQLYGYPDNRKNFTTLESEKDKQRQTNASKVSSGLSVESKGKNKK